MLLCPTLPAQKTHWWMQHNEGLTPEDDIEIGKYGYIDRSGDWKIPPRFDRALPFSEGLAAVANCGVWGFIDSKGEFQIPPQFSFAYSFSDGLARVRIESGSQGEGFIRRNGEVAFTIPAGVSADVFFFSGRLMFEDKGKWGLMDSTGRSIVTPQFDALDRGGTEGLWPAQQSGKWGYINSDGRMVIPLQFAAAWPFKEGQAAVLVGEKWGFIATDGAMVVTPRFDSAGPVFFEGLIQVAIDGHMGFADREGKYFRVPHDGPDESHWFQYFSDGRAPIKQNRKWGFVDKTGQVVIPPQFDNAQHFSNGLASVSIKDEKNGFINTSGRFVRVSWEKSEKHSAKRFASLADLELRDTLEAQKVLAKMKEHGPQNPTPGSGTKGMNAQENLLSGEEPKFPPKDGGAADSDDVLLVALINPDGSVYDVQAVRGGPVLARIAVEAVRHWKYRAPITECRPTMGYDIIRFTPYSR